MGDFNRQSPVRFESRPLKTEARDHWVVVIQYEDEGPGPWLVDLCHSPRWDLQAGRLDELTAGMGAVPPVPGDCRWENGVLVNRMNRTQAALWHLHDGQVPELPAAGGYTDVTEASVFLALFGPGVFSIAERLTRLDLMDPKRRPPFLFQGPFAHVPCQLVVLARQPDRAGALLLAASRGYARDMVHAILDAGAPFGLRPAGQGAFGRYLETVDSATAAPLEAAG